MGVRMKMNLKEKLKEINEILSIILKIGFPIAFFIGSCLLGFYFISIGFVPYLKIKEFPFIVLLVFFVGAFIVFFMGMTVIIPSIYLKKEVVSLDRKNSEKTEKLYDFLSSSKPKSIIFHFLPWILNVSLLFALSYARSVTEIEIIIAILFSIGIIFLIQLLLLKNFLVVEKEKCFKRWFSILKLGIKHLLIVSIYFNSSFWCAFIIYYRIISSSEIEISLGLIILFAMISWLNYVIFKQPDRNIVFLVIIVPFVLLLLFNRLAILYSTPIRLLKLGLIDVDIYLKKISSNDSITKSSQLSGRLLFRDSDNYYIRIKTKNGNKIKIIPVEKIDSIIFKDK